MTDPGEMSDVVIIGGVACGPKTAATLARRLPDLKITLFQKEKDLSYGTCGMPYFASGDIPSFEELVITSYGVVRDSEFFLKTKGFTAVPEAEVISVDRDSKTVSVRLLSSGESFEHGYDKLVIATGAEPNQPPFSVADDPRVRSFTRPEDARHFRSLAEKGQVGRAVIVGGGFIGCELAEATASLWGIETTLIEKEDQLLPYVLDPEMADLVAAEVRRQDVTVHTGAAVESIDLDNDNLIVRIDGRDPVTTDYVFLCVGVHANVSLARACGLEIGETGAIEVNDRLQTSGPSIYAGGDCVEMTHQLTGAKIFTPMGSLANRHGRVIAENIAGNETEFPGVLGAFLVKVFDSNVGSVGLTEQAARGRGLNAAGLWGSFVDHAEYYPESRSMVVKIVYDENNLKLLGLQAVGAGDITRRIDVFSTFLQHGDGVDDLLDFEHGYAPPYSEALDPLHHLAGMAIAKQKGLVFASPRLVDADRSADVLWLDVREVEEHEGSKVNLPPGEVVNIPLGALRDRLSELDRSRAIAIICRRGPRSYQAAMILEQAGFKNVQVIGGGTTAIAGSDDSGEWKTMKEYSL